MKWGTGDDQAALQEYRTRLERWFAIKGTAAAKQADFIIFQSGEKGEEQLKDTKNVWDRFEQSIGLADNFRVHRLNLISYKQQEMESIDEFYTRCWALAMKWKFGKSLDERIIDQLIIGTCMAESRRELLKGDENLTIDNALNQCRAHEASEAHMKAFEKAGTSRVDAVTQKPRQKQVTDCKFCALDHPFGK